ncbi:MAG: MFS transporter, partial [Hyphomicrobiales bacterium]|nr:MFS transporter [Hyphomicrobiales bacterium]
AVFAVSRLARLSPSLHRLPNDRDIGRQPPRAPELTTKANDPNRIAGDNERPVGGGVLDGIMNALRSPYLVGVGAFLLLYPVTSTFVYFQQAEIVQHSFADRGAQTAFFANIDFGVNALALIVQLFFSGRVIVLLGVSLALGLLPVLTMAGFAALALTPSLTVIAVFQIIRRAADYAITRPAREVLYTVVPREDRYKTKGFIDTFVYRVGDQAGAWSNQWLNGAGSRAAPLVGVAVAVLWLMNALWLGRRQQRLETANASSRTL